MSTTSEELKKLYFKLGGEDANIKRASTPAEILNAINELDLSIQYELPAVSSTDNGKALGVVEGKWNKMDIPTELPAVTSDDNGKLLGVSEGAWGKVDAPTELPAFDPIEDEGKVLAIEGGVLVWSTLVPGYTEEDPPSSNEEEQEP